MLALLMPLALLASHIPPPLYLHLHALEDRAELEVVVYAEVYEEWTDHLADEDDRLADAVWRDERGARVRSAMERTLAITVDGVAVLPTPRSMEFQPGIAATDYFPYVRLVFDLETKGAARRISVRLVDLDLSADFGVPKVPFLYDQGPQSELNQAFLDEDEPAFVWHAPPETIDTSPAWDPPAPRQITLPVLSLVAIALAIASLFLPVLPVPRWPRLLAGAVLAIALAPFGHVALSDPFSGPPALDPQEVQARFIARHRNIYRAFDHDDEERIYDTLARSVGPELLESVYSRVYEQLILRDEGGAVAKVRHVEMLETRIEADLTESARGYRIFAKWRVQGEVRHDGHQHTRTLTCRARYLFASGPDGWKIREEEMLGTEREEHDIASFTDLGGSSSPR